MNDSTSLKFNKFISRINFDISMEKILLAVSGGIDSVVLVHLCKDAKLDVAIAHCNFNLRDKESDADADFVKDLATRYNVDIHYTAFDTTSYSKEHKISIQVAARNLRYKWFAELLETHDYTSLFTGHHLNDSAETFFINLTRGTGLDGLTGIPEKNNKILRPLLEFSRKDIEAYAEEHHLKWREDSSNASEKYLRNAIRHNVIPKLNELNDKFLQNYQATQKHLQQTAVLVEDYTRLLVADIVTEHVDSYELSLVKLKKYSNTEAVLYQLLKDFGFTEWDNVAHLIDAQTGKQVLSATHRLIKDRDRLILTSYEEYPGEDTKIEEVSIDNFEKSVEFLEGVLNFENVSRITNIAANILYVDFDKLEFPLIIRPWRKGDIFQPIGMKGRKKLSDFFKDEKLSLLQKKQSFVLECNDEIVWIIGYRADDRYKITTNTQDITKIIWQA